MGLIERPSAQHQKGLPPPGGRNLLSAIRWGHLARLACGNVLTATLGAARNRALALGRMIERIAASSVERDGLS
jgi:hypothetical protein